MLRSKAPQLVDIEIYVCHYIHSTIKQFSKSFEFFVDKWIDDDIHWNTKYSTNILDLVKEICFILNVLFRKPPQRVSHLWLSVFDCLSTDMSFIDPCIWLYYTWIPNDFCEISRDIKTNFLSMS